MCGGSYVGRGIRHGAWRRHGGGEFLERDVEKLSPGARISAALSVLVPVGLSGVFLVAFVPACGGSSLTSGSLSRRSACSQVASRG
jgi:hypothetical protein